MFERFDEKDLFQLALAAIVFAGGVLTLAYGAIQRDPVFITGAMTLAWSIWTAWTVMSEPNVPIAMPVGLLRLVVPSLVLVFLMVVTGAVPLGLTLLAIHLATQTVYLVLRGRGSPGRRWWA